MDRAKPQSFWKSMIPSRGEILSWFVGIGLAGLAAFGFIWCLGFVLRHCIPP